VLFSPTLTATRRNSWCASSFARADLGEALGHVDVVGVIAVALLEQSHRAHVPDAVVVGVAVEPIE